MFEIHSAQEINLTPHLPSPPSFLAHDSSLHLSLWPSPPLACKALPIGHFLSISFFRLSPCTTCSGQKNLGLALRLVLVDVSVLAWLKKAKWLERFFPSSLLPPTISTCVIFKSHTNSPSDSFSQHIRNLKSPKNPLKTTQPHQMTAGRSKGWSWPVNMSAPWQIHTPVCTHRDALSWMWPQMPIKYVLHKYVQRGRTQ